MNPDVWIESDNPNGYVTGKRFSIDLPSPTVMAAGMGGDSLGHWHIMRRLKKNGDVKLKMKTHEFSETKKPPYNILSMAEIAALPKNGYKVVSTFSGCGGSCLGFEMAGFEVLWANEFVPAARDTYALNHPRVILDPRDIRTVKPEEILSSIGMKAGEIDVLEGSPPCASFSTAGKREAGWGKVKSYSDTKQRTDDLFFEFTRLLTGLQPKVFVAENVSGLVKGTAKGYFLEILAALKACGYKVRCQVLDAQWLGVPQMRQRVIFIGVRSDLGAEPAFPKPLGYRYSVRDALPWISAVSNLLPGKKPGMQDANFPCPTVTTGDTGGNGRHKVEAEADMSRFAVGREAKKLKPGESTFYGGPLTKTDPEKPCPTITQLGGIASASSVVHPTECRKFSIAELKRICAFPDDFKLTGTYAQQWERLGRAVPPLMMRAVAETVRDSILAKISASPQASQRSCTSARSTPRARNQRSAASPRSSAR